METHASSEVEPICRTLKASHEMHGGLQQREGSSNQSNHLYVWTNFNLGWNSFVLVMSVCLYA